MNTMTRFFSVTCATLVLAMGATGCSGDDDDDDEVVLGPDLTGTLTTEWSIDGSFEPSNCRVYGASDYELVVYDLDNFIVAEQQTPCEEFVLSFDLPVGSYSADATLVDSEDFSVSLTQVLDDLEIIEGTELVVSIDFPASLMITSRDEEASK